jgi:8-amino-7-oxononanoate synthase
VLSHFNVNSERIIYMGTLGKAAGVCGAFVAAGAWLIDYLVNRARTYIYTTASPPFLASALLRSLEIIRSEDWRRQRLSELIQILTAGLDAVSGRLLPSATAIQPFVIGAPDDAVRSAETLAEAGMIAPAVRPPTVPRGSARLRISLSAGHEVAEVERLAAALRRLAA